MIEKGRDPFFSHIFTHWFYHMLERLSERNPGVITHNMKITKYGMPKYEIKE